MKKTTIYQFEEVHHHMRTVVTIVNLEVVRALRGLVVLPEERRVHSDVVFRVYSSLTN